MSQSLVKGGGAQNVWIDIISSAGGRKTDVTAGSVTIQYLVDDDTSATTMSLTAGTVGVVAANTFVHYSNGIYQLTLPAEAFSTGNRILVQWSGSGIATGEVAFNFGASTLGINDDISFSTELLVKLRYLIDDTDESDYQYSDARLNQLLLVAACYVKCDINADYVVDIEAGTITPDPTTKEGNLIVLKAACILTSSEAKTAAACNVKIVDGPSTIQTPDMYKSLKDMGDQYCSDYKLEVLKYNTGQTGGCSSTTPYGTSYGYANLGYWPQ